MARFCDILLAALLVRPLLAHGADQSDVAALPEDRAVVATALKDFAEWEGATFGKLSGVLVVAPKSLARTDLTPESVKDLAPRIRARISDELATAFIRRNRVAVSIHALVAGLGWTKVRAMRPPDEALGRLPGEKAEGHVTLPGFSADGASALMQIRHSWSIHGATVTYVLAKKGGTWRVVARDQVVFW